MGWCKIKLWTIESYEDQIDFLSQPTQYLTITTHNADDTIEDSDVEKIHLKKLLSLLKTNLCNVSVLSESDLELLSNLDPNSVADVITKDYVKQLKAASSR